MKTTAEKSILFILPIVLVAVATAIFISSPTLAAGDSKNLIQNPSLEIDADSDNIPDQWFKGNWGNNNAVFTYPVEGIDGIKAARIDMTSYKRGDAKWYFADVPVIPGETYIFRDKYISTAVTSVVARYKKENGVFAYECLGIFPSTSEWKIFEASFTPPDGTVSATVFHLIKKIGSLTVDEFYLAKFAPDNSSLFNQGFISLSFDDGWRSQFDFAKPILDAAELKGVFNIVSQETLESAPKNRVQNPSLEIDADSDNIPDQWFKGNWGNNNAVFTYPVEGIDGIKAARVEIDSYMSGDAKWYFADVPIMPNQTYAFCDRYISSVPSRLVARITTTAGEFRYIEIASADPSPLWAPLAANFYTPPDARSATVFHLIESVGSLAIDNVWFDRVSPYLNPSDVLALQAAGHEIGSHTRTHPSLTTLAPAEAENEIAGSRADLLAMDAAPVSTIAYPYGDYNESIIQIVRDAGFSSGRTVNSGYNTKISDKFALLVQHVNNKTTVGQVKSWIDTAVAYKKWLILVFHQIDNNGFAYGTTPAVLEGIVNYLKNRNVPVKTMGEGISLMQ